MELLCFTSSARLTVPLALCQSSSPPNSTASTSLPKVRTCQSLSLAYPGPSISQNSMRSGRSAKVQWQVRCGVPLEEHQAGAMKDRSNVEGDEEGQVDNGEGDGLARTKLAVFVSGGGSNFRAIHAGCLSNAIYGDVIFVVSDKPDCKGCEYARGKDIPVLAYPKGKHAPDGISPTELVHTLRHAGVEYILLAGYLRLLPSELVLAYPRAILNIHPALLPSFGGKGYFGAKVHEAVIRSGARYSGATVHFVDEKYDSGPILAQRVVRVLADDTPSALASRVLEEEHKMYAEAVAALCEDRIFWREDGVPIIRKSWDEAEYM